MEEHNVNAPAAKNYSSFYVPGAIVVAGVAVAAALYFGLAQKSGTPSAHGDGQPVAVDIKDVKTAGDPYIGKADAPAVLASWEDYQCPFCKQFETTVLPSLVKKYVVTGKLKIVFKDFAFLGNDSVTASEYARAIWDIYPAQFESWHAAMYEAQDEEGDRGFGNVASIDALIKSKFPQIDDAKVKARIASQKKEYDAAIAADRAEGGNFGINGTPGFVTGTALISGAQPLSAFTAAIDAQLK